MKHPKSHLQDIFIGLLSLLLLLSVSILCLRINICESVFQARRGTHGGGGTTVTEGTTRVSHCKPLTSPENASLSCEESRLTPSFSPPNPTHHVSHLDWRPLGQNTRERGWAQPQSREPIRRRRTELGKKELDIPASLGGARSETLIFFLSVFAPLR